MGWDIEPKYSAVGAGREGSQERGQLLKGIPSLGGWGDPPAEPASPGLCQQGTAKPLGTSRL